MNAPLTLTLDDYEHAILIQAVRRQIAIEAADLAGFDGDPNDPDYHGCVEMLERAKDLLQRIGGTR